MMDLWNYLKSTDKKIVLYGIGNGADKIIKVLEYYGIEFHGVFATDGFVRDKIFHDFKLSTYTALKEQFSDMVVLLCFGSAREEVFSNVQKIMSENEFFAPDVPVCGDNLFNMEFAKANKEKLERVYNLLADDLSKKTFECVVKFKLTGDVRYLFECETDANEPYDSFLKLSDKEIFADFGAYRGDTVEDFLSRVSSYQKVYAVEPDRKTFKKLLSALEDKSDIIPVNACVSNFDGVTEFSMSGSRGSTASKGQDTVKAISMDTLLKDGVTFIKMDVEGNEGLAIDGGKNIILNYKPKMLISCYHRSEDVFDLPLRVADIRDDYKIYMRHFKSLPAWDTCFYFI
ncbi:MAG: FkbM family methyltransferase [Clostridia bacterium]|nr:FkbM family methyltransferase [Clostridia bacterium]